MGGGGGESPDTIELSALKVAKYGLTGHFPDIIWDGYVNESKLVDGKLPPSEGICVMNGDVSVLNVDAGNNYQNVVDDLAAFTCELPKLKPVTLL